MDRTSELAAQWGIDTEYLDAYGCRRTADPDTVSRIIAAIASDRVSPRLLPASIVFRRGRDQWLSLPPLAGPLHWSIFLEEQEIASGTAQSMPMAIPDHIPLGTFRLRMASPAGEVNEETVLLVAPEHAYQGNGNRLWGLAVQLYGVRSHRNWGHGDFTDLAALIALGADLGAAAIGVNPLHAVPDAQASPYSPSSRMLLNPLYIDVNAIPEFPGARAAGLEPAVRKLRRQDHVDFSGVTAAKLAGLRLAYRNFRRNGSARRRRDFENFRRQRGPTLARFASFEFLRRRFQRVWWEWPPEWRQPDEARLSALRQTEGAEIGFFEFVQWIADGQLNECRALASRLGLPIGLYLDLAIGVEAGGADAWSEQDAILNTLSLGAPPDPLNAAGQNWGLAGFNPAGLQSRLFEPFRQTLRASMRYAGAIRIDHVLGLNRLFFIPHGKPAQDGTYVRLPFEPLLAVVAQESWNHKCIVIGEDLGTVPANFRATLADWGIWSYRVMMFERAQDGSFLPPEHYAPNSVVTFNTHDLPTFAGWAIGHDLRTKRALGFDPGESDEDRTKSVAALRAALQARGLQSADFTSVAKYLAGTPSRLLVVSMEDALGLQDQPNVPGTRDEHPNWRQRLPIHLEDLSNDERLRALAGIMAAEGRKRA
jgi:4-alpha-glucanotransferase